MISNQPNDKKKIEIKNYLPQHITSYMVNERPFYNEIKDKIAPQNIKSNLTLTFRNIMKKY